MNTGRRNVPKWADWGSRSAIVLGFAGSVTVLLMWSAGTFAPKVLMPAERASASADKASGIVAPVRRVRLPMVETAVGTVRPVHEAAIGARLLARVQYLGC